MHLTPDIIRMRFGLMRSLFCRTCRRYAAGVILSEGRCQKLKWKHGKFISGLPHISCTLTRLARPLSFANSSARPVAKPISIRLGEYEDVSVIADFMIAMAKETEEVELEADTVKAGVTHLLNAPQYGFYIVATCEDAMIGCMMITYEWSDWRNAVQWWIQSVYVKPGHRRQGVFGKLYAFAKAMAQGLRDVCGLRLYVEEHNENAMKTYRSLGMEPAGYAVYEARIDR